MVHDRSAYIKGCRCDECRAANAAYSKEYRRRRPESQFVEYRNCLQCGTRFGVTHGNAARGFGRYCTLRCFGASQRKADGDRTSRRAERIPDHPLANQQGRVLSYRRMLFEKIGPGSHACHWCGRLVNWNARIGRGVGREDLIVDHLDGNKQNNGESNLVPACNFCNTLRAHIKSWKDLTGLPIVRLEP
jgi:hypothetical protein